MTSPINDFQDILKAMEHDPALRDALRRHILTDELLQVPVRLERIEGYVGTLQEGVITLTADATTLKEGQARLEQGQTELREEFRSANLRINQIAGDMGNLRGNEYERRIRFRVLYRAGAEFGIQSPDIALSQNDPRSPPFSRRSARRWQKDASPNGNWKTWETPTSSLWGPTTTTPSWRPPSQPATATSPGPETGRRYFRR